MPRPGFWRWLHLAAFYLCNELSVVVGELASEACELDIRGSLLLQVSQTAARRERSRAAEALGESSAAATPPDRSGYAAVVASNSRAKFNVFVNTLAASMGLRITNATAVDNFLHSVGDSESFIAPSLLDLQMELIKGSAGGNPWLVRQSRSTIPKDASGKSNNVPSTVLDHAETKTTDSASLLSVGTSMDQQAQERSSVDADRSLVIHGSLAGLETGLGANVALDDTGFRSVLQLNSSHESEIFLRRFFRDSDLTVIDDNGLKSLISDLDADSNPPSFGDIKGQILNLLDTPEAWIADSNDPRSTSSHKTTGASFIAYTESAAPLTSAGLLQISRKRSHSAMVGFINRLVKSMGLEVRNAGGPEGLAPYFNGEKQVGNLMRLKEEIRKASLLPDSWVGPEKSSPSS